MARELRYQRGEGAKARRNDFIKFNKGLMNGSIRVRLWLVLLIAANLLIHCRARAQAAGGSVNRRRRLLREAARSDLVVRSAANEPRNVVQRVSLFRSEGSDQPLESQLCVPAQHDVHERGSQSGVEMLGREVDSPDDEELGILSSRQSGTASDS